MNIVLVASKMCQLGRFLYCQWCELITSNTNKPTHSHTSFFSKGVDWSVHHSFSSVTHTFALPYEVKNVLLIWFKKLTNRKQQNISHETKYKAYVHLFLFLKEVLKDSWPKIDIASIYYSTLCECGLWGHFLNQVTALEFHRWNELDLVGTYSSHIIQRKKKLLYRDMVCLYTAHVVSS